MPTGPLLILLLSNAAWSANPIFAKWILKDFSPQHVSLFRYGAAWIGFIVLHALVAQRQGWPSLRKLLAPGRDWVGLSTIGVLTFSLCAFLNMYGLQYTRATDAALIISFEPLIVALVGWLVLKERPSLWLGVGFACALTGFALLSRLSSAQIRELFQGGSLVLLGNVVILVSLVGEAVFSAVGRILLDRGTHPLRVYFGSLTVGVALTLGVSTAWAGLPTASLIGPHVILAMLWMGVLGTTGGYVAWLFLMDRRIPIATLALTLFLQPVLGSVWGRVFLGEHLVGAQVVGAALILLGVVSQLFDPFGGGKKEVAPGESRSLY